MAGREWRGYCQSGEFGVGTRHLYHCLQRLAVIEPQYIDTSEPETLEERIFNEPDGVYRYVITADGLADGPFEPSQKLEIIRF